MEGVKDLVKVLTTSNRNVELETAAKTVWELGMVGKNKLKLVEEEGLIGGLVRVMRKDGESYRVAREDAVGAITSISYEGSDEVKKKLFKHEGLVAGLVEILGQKGSEYKWARENAVGAIDNIANGDDEVKAGLFDFPNLRPRIEAISGDGNLNGPKTKDMALKLKEKFEHMGGGGQSNPPSTQSSGPSTVESMEKKLADLHTELATMKSILKTVRTEQAVMADSLFRVEKALEKALATPTSALAPTESLDSQWDGKVAKREGVIKEEEEPEGSGKGKRKRNSYEG
jgi:hypothetical protein